MDVTLTDRVSVGARHRARWPCTLTVFVLLWTVVLLAHLALSGRWWLWLIPAAVPPLVFVGVPVLLGAGLVVARVRRGTPARRMIVLGAVLITGLVAGLPQSGVVVPSFRRDDDDAVAPPIRVVSWNSDFWDQDDDPEVFFRYLRDFDADVYLLQERWVRTPRGPAAADDLATVQHWFPGYRAVTKGPLLTLSRLPVADVPAVPADRVLRTDVQVSGERLALVNVHVPVQFRFELGVLDPAFYRDMRERDRARKAKLGVVADEVADRGDRPTIVAGDFNSSAAMGELGPLRGAMNDAAAEAGRVLPLSWQIAGLRLWRVDWAFTSGGVRALDYDLRDPQGMSDHDAQVVELAVGGDQ